MARTEVRPQANDRSGFGMPAHARRMSQFAGAHPSSPRRHFRCHCGTQTWARVWYRRHVSWNLEGGARASCVASPDFPRRWRYAHMFSRRARGANLV